MLQLVEKARPVRQSKAAAPVAKNTPPVIVASQPKHPIYGLFPFDKEGYSLEDQPIHVLDRWHAKATELLQPWNSSGDITKEQEAYFEELHGHLWKIHNAAIALEARTGRELALQMEIIVRHTKENIKDDATCEYLHVDTLAAMAKAARKISEPARPTKSIGALSRGKKLTRAGLLHRYHAFLIGELSTLGVAFYGCRDYALKMMPIEDAVTVRTHDGFKNGKYDPNWSGRRSAPFFNESKLPDRARSVLKSLKIDIETADRR